MDIQEMHIEFDLLAQEVNSVVLNNVEPEEIDWLLNDEIKRFVSQRINPAVNISKKGFSDNTKRLDDLQTLQVVRPIPVWYDTVNANQIRRGFALPANYLHKIRLEAFVTPCTDQVVNTTNYNIRAYAYSLPPTTYNYSNFKIEIEDNNGFITIFDAGNYPWMSAGINTDYSFYIKDFVRNSINSQHDFVSRLKFFNCYYESFVQNFRPRSFRFVDFGGTFFNIRITDNNGTNTIPIPIAPVQIDNVAGYTLSPIDVDFYSGEEIRERLIDSYTKPDLQHGIAEIQQNLIYLYLKDNMYCDRVDFTYLRQPKRVSLDMDINCDIHEAFHHEIVDNAVTRFKALVASGEYRSVMAENLKQE